MNATTQDGKQLHYQPVADLLSGSLAGFEATISLRPVGEASLIGDAFAIAPDIDEQTLGEIFQDIQGWKNQGFNDVCVAVSISLKQFRDPHLADKIGAALAAAKLNPSQLSLQFTENHLMENPQAGETTLRDLRMLGVNLVLDHFGAGFGSLSYLRRYPFDAVRIDPTLVQTADTDSEAAATAKAIISMAHSLGLRVKATDVQTEIQCEFLRHNMCDEIQGAFYLPPMVSDQVALLLREPPKLPQHLLRYQKPTRTLLLVDDEVNILSALKRLLRRDGYQILQANSGQEGLELLAKNEVDVIVSDQRMPGMTGVEFLSEAKIHYPDTVRIVLSGYTELQSVTDAINEGAIYKFLTKPWEDQLIRGHIESAFKHKEMADDNRRLQLEVQQANHEMAAANRKLEEVLKQQQLKITRDENSLDIVREILQHVPLAVIGLDEDDVVVFANGAALDLFRHVGPILGDDAMQLMPNIMTAANEAATEQARIGELNGIRYQVLVHAMGKESESRGRILTLMTLKGDAHGDRLDH